MMYKLGTLEEYLLENPVPVDEDSPSQCRRYKDPLAENEYLWCSESGDITEAKKFDIVAVWTGSIVKPTTKKYYLIPEVNAPSGLAGVAGVVYPGSVMESAALNLEIFGDKKRWRARAKELGIEIDPEIE